jgi:hypothetical protein
LLLNRHVEAGKHLILYENFEEYFLPSTAKKEGTLAWDPKKSLQIGSFFADNGEALFIMVNDLACIYA